MKETPVYRSFCYTDWLNEFMTNDAPMTSKYLDMLVKEVAAGGADVLVVNPNGQTVSYPSKVWQTIWGKYAAGDPDVLGAIPPEEVDEHRAMLDQYKALSDSGCDFLGHLAEACRDSDLAFGVSVRMNDVHGVMYGRNYLVSDFWYDHPELRLSAGPQPACLNYEKDEVRAYFLSLIQEILRDYTPDVLDLDFLRRPYYFPEGNTAGHCAIMTDFISSVRKEIAKAGKPVALLARIPSSPILSMNQGFDIATWAQEGLVDGLVVGTLLHSAWDISVTDFRKLVGDGIAIYPSTDWFADTRDGLQERVMGLEPELMKGFAAGHLANGADGIYWFNFVVARQENTIRFMDKPKHRDETRPCFEAIGQSNSLEQLRGVPKTYATYASNKWHDPLDPPDRLPFDILPEQVKKFTMLLSTETAGASVALAVIFRSDQEDCALWIRSFNSNVLNLSAVIESDPTDVRTASFRVPISALEDGLNEIVLRNGKEQIRVLGIEVRVV